MIFCGVRPLFGKNVEKNSVILYLFAIAFLSGIRYNYIGRKLFFVKAFTLAEMLTIKNMEA